MIKTKTKRSNKTIIFITILALCITMIPIFSLAEGQGVDRTGIVTFSNVKLFHGGSSEAFITDGVKVDPMPTITKGDRIDISLDFSISAASCQQINKGDFMEIDVPYFYGFTVNTVGILAKTPEGKPFGTYYLRTDGTSYKLQVIFDQEDGLKQFATGVSGKMEANGEFSQGSETGQDFQVGSVLIPAFPVDPGQTQPSNDGPYKDFFLGKAHKYGNKKHGTPNVIEWTVHVNNAEYAKALRGEAVTPAKNVIIEDTLSKELSYKEGSIAISYDIFMHSHENVLVANTMYQNGFNTNISDQLKEPVKQTAAHTTYELFKQAVAEKEAPCYGIYKSSTGRETLVLNMGDLPGSIYTNTWGEIESSINSYAFNWDKDYSMLDAIQKAAIKENTINGYKRLFNNENPAQSDRAALPGFTLSFDTTVNTNLKDLYVTNVAIFNQDSSTVNSNIWDMNFHSLSISVSEMPAGSIRITKVDADSTETVLTGASFKLVGEKTGTTATKFVNDEGYVDFTDLLSDTYTITEVDMPKGYEGELVILKEDGTQLAGNKFTIDLDKQRIGFKFKALNSKKLGSLSVTKLDSETTSKAIEGAIFTLETLKGDEWVPYYGEDGNIHQERTDGNGKATFANLPWGKYRLVEKETPEGYIGESLTFDVGENGEFEIGRNSIDNILTAYNDPEEPEEEIKTTDPGIIPPEDDDVLGIIDYYDDDGSEDKTENSVLGEEAKTADVSNLVPLLVIIAIVTLILLIVAVRNREDTQY